MKSISFLLLMICCGIQSYSQTTIKIEDISQYNGQTVTVCSKVYGTKYLDRSNSQPTFLNVGAAYPNSPLTVVIFGKDRDNFKTAPEDLYKGRNICVTGEVKEFKDKYEIVVSKPEQITIQE